MPVCGSNRVTFSFPVTVKPSVSASTGVPMFGDTHQITPELTARAFYSPEKGTAEPWLSMEIGGATVNMTLRVTPETPANLRKLADDADRFLALAGEK